MKQVRIKDIAEKAGVSIGTVDRVLHNRGEVKQATRDKVLSIAKELNYKPNIAARVLKSPTIYNIAVLIPKSSNDNLFWNMHPKGIKQAEKSVHPYVVETTFYYYEMHSGEDFKVKAEAIIASGPDGVILAPVLKNESLAFCESLERNNIPFVFIDTYIDNTRCLSFFGEDAFQSGRVAASLVDFGIHDDKDILIINIAKNLENVQHLSSRNQGFMSYFMEMGRNKRMKISVEVPDSNEDNVTEALDKVFKNNTNIGAVLVSSSRTYAVARYLEENQIDLLVVGYEVFGQNITYLQKGIVDFLIGQRPVEQAEKAFKSLFEYLSNNSIPKGKEYQSIDIVNAENINLYK